MIVCCDDDQWNLFDRRNVEALVRCPGLHPAFPNRRQTHKSAFALKFFCEQNANGH